mmetsp:Transcript_85227/g.241503  ORF Transcript_85227/g.241503 Transcript_85227/m.241503 type:complete len:131 (+) Transcript_85227:306-698(+)
MRVFQEEQFGPVMPIATFSDVEEVHTAIKDSWNGQQAAVFTSDTTGKSSGPMIDRLSTVVGRININTQCARSPDSFPFAGRRSSAMGTMSIVEALKGFSVETVVSYSASNDLSSLIANGLDKESNFLAKL